jgi:tetratricopeptide (TPR) repeat protein
MPFPSIFREPLKGSQVLAQALDARTTEADRLLQQGIEQSKAGQLETALQSLQQALDIYREIGKQNGEERIRRREGVTLGSMGLVLGKLGEYNQAINYCQEWLDIAKINSQKKDEAAALLCLGVNYIELEKPIQAIEKLKQSLALTQ